MRAPLDHHAGEAGRHAVEGGHLRARSGRSTSTIASGVAGCGVSRRTRSLVGRSAASAVKPLMPVPPMSRQKVIGDPVFLTVCLAVCLAIPAPPLE